MLAGCISPTIESFRGQHQEFIRRATYLPPVTVMGTYLPDGSIHNEPGELAFTQVALDALVPIPLSDDDFLIAGAIAGVRHVQFEGVPVLADDQLQRYGIRLGYGTFVNDDLLVQGFWQPSIYSDFDGTLNSADYRLGYGTFATIYRATPTCFWKVGLTVNDMVDTGVVPFGGFAWHFAERLSLQVLVPRDASLVYEDGPWTLVTGLLLESEEYHVRSPAALGLQDDVHVQELYAHLTVERRLGSNLSVLLRGGTTLAGHWDWGYGNGTDDLSGTLEPSWFVGAGLGYRF